MIERLHRRQRAARQVLQALEDHADAEPPGTIQELRQRGRAGRIDQRHAAEPQDQHARRLEVLVEQVVEAVRNREEQRPGDFVNLDTGRKARARVAICGGLRVVGLRFDQLHAVRDLDDLGHAMHEQECCQHHADLDGDCEVDRDGEREGHQQHQAIADRSTHQVPE